MRAKSPHMSAQWRFDFHRLLALTYDRLSEVIVENRRDGLPALTLSVRHATRAAGYAAIVEAQ